MAKQNGTKVITDRVRLSYAHVFKPYSGFTNQEPKYSAVLLIPKTDKSTLKAIKAAQEAALEQGKDKKFGGRIPKNWKSTLRDGDSENDDGDLYSEKNPEYAGHYFMSVTSNQKPGIVDRAREAIEDESEVYSGCYARVSINAFAFSAQGNKGVSFGLQNIQKLADGEVLGGTASRAEDDFDDELDDEDDTEDII